MIKNTRNFRLVATLGAVTLASLGALTGCGDDADSMDGGGGAAATGGSTSIDDAVTLQFDLTGLEPLAGGFEYEGWFVSADGPVSGGRFNLKKDTTVAEVTIDKAALEGADTFVLTIEPPEADDDPAPSKTHVLAGAWDGATATLTIDHAAALGDDFTSATGSYFLETPTTAAMDDANLGIWFITPSDPMSPGLDLPSLPEGWIYEGWVAGPDGPVSTGTFLDASMADDDGAGTTSGPDDAPPFPGQDFIDPAMDLVAMEHHAVISVEPSPDDSPLPFAFKPLAGLIADEGAGTPQDLDNKADSAPAGTVSVK